MIRVPFLTPVNRMLDRITHDQILELRLARPPVNALSPALVAQLRPAIADAAGQGFRAVVLSGMPKIFSGGLDIVELIELDRAGMIAFWGDFFGLMAAIARSPIPVVAAITGHSPAGGAVLSIFCDYRVMARSPDPEKPFRIGLNEVQVGLMVPEVIQLALRRLVGAHRAERLMVAGAMVDSDEALRIGFVDELVAIDDVVPRAIAWCQQHLALPPLAMSNTRRFARSDLAELMGDTRRFPAEDFASMWFGEETQAVLRAVIEKLKSKK